MFETGWVLEYIFSDLDCSTLRAYPVNRIALISINNVMIKKCTWLSSMYRSRGLFNAVEGKELQKNVNSIRGQRVRNLQQEIKRNVNSWITTTPQIFEDLIHLYDNLVILRDGRLVIEISLFQMLSIAHYMEQLLSQMNEVLIYYENLHNYASIQDTKYEKEFIKLFIKAYPKKPSGPLLALAKISALSLTKLIHTVEGALPVLVENFILRLEPFISQFFHSPTPLKEVDILNALRKAKTRKFIPWNDKIQIAGKKYTVSELFARDIYIIPNPELLHLLSNHQIMSDVEDSSFEVLESIKSLMSRIALFNLHISADLGLYCPGYSSTTEPYSSETQTFKCNISILSEYGVLHRSQDPLACDTIHSYIHHKYLLPSKDFKIDCSNLSLQRIDLSYAILSGVNFDGADLSRANLTAANLIGCSLSKTNMAHAILEGASIGDSFIIGNAITTGISEVVIEKAIQNKKTKLNANIIHLIEALQNWFQGGTLSPSERKMILGKLVTLLNTPDNIVTIQSLKISTLDIDSLPEPSLELLFNYCAENIPKAEIKQMFQSDLLSALNIAVELLEHCQYLNIEELETIKRNKKKITALYLKHQYEALKLDFKMSRFTNFLLEYTKMVTTHIGDCEDTILDLTDIDEEFFKKLDMGELNFSGIQVNAKQLKHSLRVSKCKGIQPALLYQVQKLKFQWAIELLHRTMKETLDVSRMLIEESANITKLACYGSPPLIDSLTEQQIAIFTYICLTSMAINKLDESHPYHYSKLGDLDTPDYLNKDIQTIRGHLNEILVCNKNLLFKEQLALVYLQKLPMYFNSVDDTFLELSDVNNHMDDYTPEDRKEITKLRKILKETKEELQSKRDTAESHSARYYLDVLVEDFPNLLQYEDKSKILEKIQFGVDISTKLHPLDLSTLKLSREELNTLDFSVGFVKFSDSQIRNLSPAKLELEVKKLKEVLNTGNVKEISTYWNLEVLIDITDDEGRTPLMTAAWNDELEVVGLLLERKADVNILSRNVKLSVMESVTRGSLPFHRKALLTQLFMEHGAILDFHSAVALGDWEKLKAIINQNPQIVHTQSHGQGPLHIAVTCNNIQILNQLLSLKNNAPSVLDKNSEDLIPLQLACMEGRTEAAQLLITHTKDLSVTDRQGLGLVSLCLQKNAELAKTLVAMGAPICVEDVIHLGFTDSRLQNFINKNGVNYKYREGKFSLLHLAIRARKIEVVNYLIQQNASLDVSCSGESAFMLACRTDSNIVRLLLNHQKAKHGPSSIDPWMKELYFHGSPLWHAILVDNLETVKILLEHDADVNFQHNSRSCLYEAVRKNKVEMAKALLEKRANPNFISQGISVLHTAIRNKCLETTKLLLDFGASVIAMDSEGNMAIHVAAETKNMKLVKLIFQATFSIKNNKNKSPLELLSNNLDIDRFLEELKES